MHDIFETLEQTEMWYGQDDFPYKLSEMAQSHRINVKNFLERRAQHLFSRAVWREFREIQNAPEEVQRAWAFENRNVLTGDPVDWLNSTPFMKALERAIKNHDTIDGEVVHDNEYRMKASPTGRLRHHQAPSMQALPPARFS